ncbi:MAG: DUF2760 domain-containing protein [Acidobacteria bacterium]|nr:DUF2760 domain-containing protein [Acidobacteriota bacterium]
MGRIGLAFRSFFSLLFQGELSAPVLKELGLSRRGPAPKPEAAPRLKVSDGALQMLGILQRDSRLIDFLMEDISSYGDEQVGAAVRDLHASCQQSLKRYFRLLPVIDGVEGTYTKIEAGARGSSQLKLLGNVPADGRVAGGVLRHKGWRAESMELPAVPGGADVTVIAPAEIEIE